MDDPRSLPDGPVDQDGTGEDRLLSDRSAAGSTRRPWYRGRLTAWSIAIAVLLVMTALILWSRSESERTAATNAGLAWERTVAISSRMQSRFRNNDRAMYILARPLPGDVRDVRIILLDNRPASNDVVTRFMLGAGLIDAGTRRYSSYMSDDGIFRAFDRHPVARLHHHVDCTTGIDTSIETEITDDMTSPPVAVISSYRPFPTRLSRADLTAVCSTDTTTRSRRIEEGR